MIQAGARRIAVEYVPVGTNPQTRPSRLMRSLTQYIRKSTLTLLRTYTMYWPLRVFSTVGLTLIVLGLLPGIRFLYLLLIGQTVGHIQSLILAAILIVVGAQVLLIGILADLVGFNRTILEETLYRVRKIDMMIPESLERGEEAGRLSEARGADRVSRRAARVTSTPCRSTVPPPGARMSMKTEDPSPATAGPARPRRGGGGPAWPCESAAARSSCRPWSRSSRPAIWPRRRGRLTPDADAAGALPLPAPARAGDAQVADHDQRRRRRIILGACGTLLLRRPVRQHVPDLAGRRRRGPRRHGDAAGPLEGRFARRQPGGPVVRRRRIARHHHRGRPAGCPAWSTIRVASCSGACSSAAGLLGVAAVGLRVLLPARRLPFKVRRLLVRFRVATHAVVRRPHLVLLAVGIGIVLQASLVLLNAWLGAACGLHLPLWAWLFAWPLAKIASMLPVSLGGLGVREAALVSLLVPFGADAASVVAAGLAFEAVIIIGGLVSGLISLLLATRRGASLCLARRGRRRPGPRTVDRLGTLRIASHGQRGDSRRMVPRTVSPTGPARTSARPARRSQAGAKDAHVVILGAGPAGAGASYRLAQRQGLRVTVLEQRDTVGGNAGSFTLDGISLRLRQPSPPSGGRAGRDARHGSACSATTCSGACVTDASCSRAAGSISRSNPWTCSCVCPPASPCRSSGTWLASSSRARPGVRTRSRPSCGAASARPSARSSTSPMRGSSGASSRRTWPRRPPAVASRAARSARSSRRSPARSPG